MAEYVKTNEKGLSELMTEYWNLRHSIGEQYLEAKPVLIFAQTVAPTDNYIATLAVKFGLDIDPAVLPALAKVASKKKSKKA